MTEIERRAAELLGEMGKALYPLSQSLGELPMMQIDIERARKIISKFKSYK